MDFDEFERYSRAALARVSPGTTLTCRERDDLHWVVDVQWPSVGEDKGAIGEHAFNASHGTDGVDWETHFDEILRVQAALLGVPVLPEIVEGVADGTA